MKREPMGNEREPDSWLGTTLRQAPAPASETCLDAETLAAWADGGLSANAAAVVELHASSCSRCTAVLGAMERSAPAASAKHVWTPARVFRWLAPLTAAATAVAIWIAVPDRPITQVTPIPAHDLTIPEPGTPNREPGTRNPEPGTQNLGPQAQERVQSAPGARVEKPAAEEQMQRDELRRERAAPQGLSGADSAAAARPTAPPAAAPPAPSSAAARTDALAETIGATAQRSALNSKVMAADSVSPSNPLIHWRIVASAAIERSTDGGKSWTKTNAPASIIIEIRAVDGDRAVARSSDSAEFYTTNGGLSWTRVQEKFAAPF